MKKGKSKEKEKTARTPAENLAFNTWSEERRATLLTQGLTLDQVNKVNIYLTFNNSKL